MTGLTDDQFTVAVVPAAEAATAHSVSEETPLDVLHRKKETANQAAATVPMLLLPSRVKLMLDAVPPFDPLMVPVRETSSRRPVDPESPAEFTKNRAVRVVSTVVMFTVALVLVPLRLVVPFCTVLPSL